MAARTSAFAFKGKGVDLRAVGEALRVGTVLEGSVRRAGNLLRITAQLVDLTSGYHLWSERYDRELTDIFAIQDEIAAAIASKLRVTLSGESAKPAARRGTSNLEAYDLFLKGLSLQRRRGRGIEAALEFFRRAVELDPGYAEPLAWMSDSYRLLAVYGFRDPASVMPQARAAAERALALDPTLAEAHATLADVALSFDRDDEAAFRSWDRALALNPAHTRARCERALWGQIVVGEDLDKAIAEIRRATEGDPLDAWAAGMLSLALGLAGHHAEAIVEARRAVDLDPEGFTARWALITTRRWSGDHEAAIAAARAALHMSGRHPWILAGIAISLARTGEARAGPGALRRAEGPGPDRARAGVLAGAGRGRRRGARRGGRPRGPRR